MRRHQEWGFCFDPSGWFSRGSRKRMWFGSGDMKYVILKLLRDKPMHGYEVMKALENQTNGCYKPSPGTVYPTLQWLDDEDLVEVEEKDGKKVYSITDSGLAFLEENRGKVEDIFERIEETLGRLFNDPMPDINRSIGRVVGQAYIVAWKLDTDSEKRRRVAEILDSAAEQLDELVVSS